MSDNEPTFDADNERMIREQILARGVRDQRVIDALRSVPRSLFVPLALRASAYDDSPLPLDRGQTISQPYIVALMTELLRLDGSERVLEIGTGSGYQTAVLARLADQIFSAELEPDLAFTVRGRLEALRIRNVVLAVGDGVQIFRHEGPFDAILCAAAPTALPEALIGQLAEGGRCLIPIGEPEAQYLWLIEKSGGVVTRRRGAASVLYRCAVRHREDRPDEECCFEAGERTVTD